MRKYVNGPAAIACVVLLLSASGCKVIDPTDANFHKSKLVLYDHFCVQFDENRTTGTFASEVVCDQFATMINEWLDGKGVDREDIKQIYMSGGKIKEGDPYEGDHRWEVTSAVNIWRTDIDDGPAQLLRNQTVRIPRSIDGHGYTPRFRMKGVKLVDRALQDLVDGGNPALMVQMVYTDVDPEPSDADPLVFSWQACIEVVAVVQKTGRPPHHGDGDDDDHGGGDDDDDDDHGKGDHDDD
jgi:hypothetical protein